MSAYALLSIVALLSGNIVFAADTDNNMTNHSTTPVVASTLQLDKTSITVECGKTEYIKVLSGEVFDFSNSNSSIATAFSYYDYDDEYYDCYEFVGITAKSIGSTTIVATDEYGVAVTINVTVKKPTITLNKTSLSIDCTPGSYYQDYEYSGTESPKYSVGKEEEAYATVYPTHGDATSIKSSNTNIVKLRWDSLLYHYDILPVGKGTAYIVFTGKYSETAKLKVTVTNKFMSSFIKGKSTITGNIKYGTTSIKGKAPASAKVKLKIGTKTCTATANSKGQYTLKNLPIVKVGTKLNDTITYHNGSYTASGKVIKPGASVSFSCVYWNSATVSVTAKKVYKGDTVTLKIGRRTYNKSIKKNSSKITYKVKVVKKKAGGVKVSATIKNKFKQTVATKNDTVKKPVIKLNKTALKIDCSYDSYYSEGPRYDIGKKDSYCTVYPVKGTFSSVKSQNPNIVKLRWESEYEWYDVLPVGKGTTSILFTGKHGEQAKLKITVTNKYMSGFIKKKSTTNNIKYGATTCKGKAPAGAKVRLKVGTKTSTATANSKGQYTIKGIPIVKIGAKQHFTITYHNGAYTVAKTVLKPDTSVSFSAILRKAKTATITVKKAHKGDVVTLKIGKKVYKKTITKNAAKSTFKMKVAQKKTEGTKVKATVSNKFKGAVKKSL